MVFEYLLTVCTEGVSYCTSKHCSQFSHLLFSPSSSVHQLASSGWTLFLPVSSPLIDPVNYLNGLLRNTAFNSSSTIPMLKSFPMNHGCSIYIYIESSMKLTKNRYKICVTVVTAILCPSPNSKESEDQHYYVIIIQTASSHSSVPHGHDIPQRVPWAGTCHPKALDM